MPKLAETCEKRKPKKKNENVNARHVLYLPSNCIPQNSKWRGAGNGGAGKEGAGKGGAGNGDAGKEGAGKRGAGSLHPHCPI